MDNLSCCLALLVDDDDDDDAAAADDSMVGGGGPGGSRKELRSKLMNKSLPTGPCPPTMSGEDVLGVVLARMRKGFELYNNTAHLWECPRGSYSDARRELLLAYSRDAVPLLRYYLAIVEIVALLSPFELKQLVALKTLVNPAAFKKQSLVKETASKGKKKRRTRSGSDDGVGEEDTTFKNNLVLTAGNTSLDRSANKDWWRHKQTPENILKTIVADIGGTEIYYNDFWFVEQAQHLKTIEPRYLMVVVMWIKLATLSNNNNFIVAAFSKKTQKKQWKALDAIKTVFISDKPDSQGAIANTLEIIFNKIQIIALCNKDGAQLARTRSLQTRSLHNAEVAFFERDFENCYHSQLLLLLNRAAILFVVLDEHVLKFIYDVLFYVRMKSKKPAVKNGVAECIVLVTTAMSTDHEEEGGRVKLCLMDWTKLKNLFGECEEALNTKRALSKHGVSSQTENRSQLAMSKAIIAYEHLQMVRKLNSNVSSLEVLTFALDHPLGESKFLRTKYEMVLIVVLSNFKRSFWEEIYTEEPVIIVGIPSIEELKKMLKPGVSAEERSGYAIGDDYDIKVRITL